MDPPCPSSGHSSWEYVPERGGGSEERWVCDLLIDTNIASKNSTVLLKLRQLRVVA